EPGGLVGEGAELEEHLDDAGAEGEEPDRRREGEEDERAERAAQGYFEVVKLIQFILAGHHREDHGREAKRQHAVRQHEYLVGVIDRRDLALAKPGGEVRHDDEVDLEGCLAYQTRGHEASYLAQTLHTARERGGEVHAA